MAMERLIRYIKLNPIRLLFVGALVIQFGLMVSVNTGILETSKIIPANNMLLGSILATISAYILHVQVNIQKRQADVEEKMLEYETKPIVDVIDKDIMKNDVEVLLSNYGNGVAVDLRLNCLVTCTSVEWFEGIPCQTPLKRKDGDEVLEDTSIRPQEGSTLYKAESITAGRQADGGQTQSNFETIMSNLLDESDAEIKIKLWVSGISKVGDYDIDCLVCDEFVVKSATEVPRSDLQNAHAFQEEV